MTTVAASKKSLHPFDAGCRGWMRKPADTNEKQPNQRSQAASKGASPGRPGCMKRREFLQHTAWSIGTAWLATQGWAGTLQALPGLPHKVSAADTVTLGKTG